MQISGLITVKDASERIGLTDKRVYQLIQEKRLESVELSRRVYLVKVKSVEMYLRLKAKKARPTGKKRARASVSAGSAKEAKG